MDENLIKKLGEYLNTREDVSFSYLFGSYVTGQTHSGSDIDIGIYFKPENTRRLEYESDTTYAGENKIWLELERITNKETDMVVLNRAPATLFDSILQNGKRITVKDERLLLRLWLAVSSGAHDFREFVDDYIKISARSQSLNPIDRERLGRMLTFFEKEVIDFDLFKKVTQHQYQSDPLIKRNLERWAENLVNSSIDIAKILLASEKKAIPGTYKLILEQLGSLLDFHYDMAILLGSFARMRNILAHEYLDIRFSHLKEFANNGEPAYRYLADYIKKLISK